MSTIFVFAVILAYLVGSVPTSVWVGRYFYGIDIRKAGSGNAGATNTFRVLGIKAGIPVLAFDVFKGWAAVKFIAIVPFFTPGTSQFINFQILLGVAAVLGHIFPIYVGFKGGKGVATLLGVVLALHPQAAFIAIGVFVAILLISKYVSLSSMIAGFSFPILIVTYFKITTPSLVIFSITIAILLLLTHQQNIERLIKKEESKAKLFKKKKKEENE